MSETRAQKQEVAAPEAVEDKLLQLLDADPDRANQRYQSLFQNLVKLFATRHCADPENLAGETITRVYQALSTGLVINLQLENFVFGVAKRVLLEDYRRQRKVTVPLDELPAEREPFVNPLENNLDLPRWQQEICHQCCHQCLQVFSEEQRNHLILFYQGNREGEMKRQRKQLASQLGITPRALSSRMLRMREKLDLCIKNCVERRQDK
jgi:RNA polymerase sigma factor (sigma-70 family)